MHSMQMTWCMLTPGQISPAYRKQLTTPRGYIARGHAVKSSHIRIWQSRKRAWCSFSMVQKRIKEDNSSGSPSPKRSKLHSEAEQLETVKDEPADDKASAQEADCETVQFKQGSQTVRRAADGRLFSDPPFLIAKATFDLSKGLKLNNKQIIKKGDLDMVYFKPLLTPTAATALYNWCLQELPWFKVQYKARGMDINTPRWVSWRCLSAI